MFKRRRFWVVAACCLSLVLVPLLGYHLWWYPRTPRGCFDRIQLGMTEAEVRAILAPLEDLPDRGGTVEFAERWTAAAKMILPKGFLSDVLYVEYSLRIATRWQGRERPG